MKSSKTRLIFAFDLLLILLLITVPVLAGDQNFVYLPFAAKTNPPPPTPPAVGRTVNAPYFNTANILQDKFTEMAVFWFGQVTSNDNYTDVRIAYNNTGIAIHTATFDRSLWYDPNSSGSNLENWDSVVVTLQTDMANSPIPGANAFRFVTGARFWQDMVHYQAQYKGNNTGWSQQSLNFSADSFYRGELGFNAVPPNGDARNRGWGANIIIPFATLGLAGPPPAGTYWRIHMQVYDRDLPVPNGPGASQIWPEDSSSNIPSTWANLHFGDQPFTSPPPKNPVTVELKNKINTTATDASVGGGSTCGTSNNFFDVWGYLNYNHSGNVIIQNQSDVADWPCFSKYYISFPYTPPPTAGKIIRSAKLVLSLWGGSYPPEATPSWIQAFSVSSSWDEATINWNNAPLAKENLSKTLVPVAVLDLSDGNNWAFLPRIEWDVTRAVNQAYTSGQSVNLALYSADSDYHSGKYFVSSDTDISWNARNLPALVIEYVDP